MLSKSIFIISLLWTVFPGYILSQELTPSIADIVSQVSPAVVMIRGEKISRTYQPGRIIIKHDYRIGSGFVVDAKGYILTCNHIISDADSIQVELKSGKKYKAKILKIDPKADISLLKINPESSLTSTKIGNPDNVRAGDTIIIIGNPLPKHVNMPPKVFKHSVTCGVIGSTERVGSNNMHLFQLSLPVNFGNSGGPLLNKYGEVIGIVNSKMLTFNNYPLEGVGFALSIKEAKDVFKELTIHKRKQVTIQSNEWLLEKNKIQLLILLAIIAFILFLILSIRIYQNRYKEYKFIKKKIYSAVYKGDYQQFSNILQKVFRNKNYINNLDVLIDDLCILQAKEPWILVELSKQLEDIKPDSLDLQRQIMKYKSKIKSILRV